MLKIECKKGRFKRTMMTNPTKWGTRLPAASAAVVCVTGAAAAAAAVAAVAAAAAAAAAVGGGGDWRRILRRSAPGVRRLWRAVRQRCSCGSRRRCVRSGPDIRLGSWMRRRRWSEAVRASLNWLQTAVSCLQSKTN